MRSFPRRNHLDSSKREHIGALQRTNKGTLDVLLVSCFKSEIGEPPLTALDGRDDGSRRRDQGVRKLGLWSFPFPSAPPRMRKTRRLGCSTRKYAPMRSDYPYRPDRHQHRKAVFLVEFDSTVPQQRLNSYSRDLADTGSVACPITA